MSEERLIRAAAHGDGAALEEFVRRLAPDVYRYLAGMLGDEREAEEATQEAFVRLARGVERYERGRDLLGWALEFAWRVALDRRPTPSTAPGRIPDEPADRVIWAQRALRALPAEHRELIVCRDVLGWELTGIAQTLGLPLEEVRSRLQAARDELSSRIREVV